MEIKIYFGKKKKKVKACPGFHLSQAPMNAGAYSFHNATQ